MVFTFQISLRKWFGNKSLCLLKIFVMLRVVRVLCGRDEEAAEKGRDGNRISYDGKSCQRRLQGALQSLSSRQQVGLKATAGLELVWFSLVFLSVV